MSTNYYAKWYISEDVTKRINIGNTSGGSTQFSTLSGELFPDRRTFVAFLRHNRQTLEIFDENGQEHSVEDIITRIETEEGASRRQIEWLKDHEYEIMPDASEFDRWPRKGQYWMDGEQLMCGSYFC